MKAHHFESISQHIASSQGVSMDRARAILASAGRHASKKAKRKNPNLKKIKGA